MTSFSLFWFPSWDSNAILVLLHGGEARTNVNFVWFLVHIIRPAIKMGVFSCLRTARDESQVKKIRKPLRKRIISGIRRLFRCSGRTAAEDTFSIVDAIEGLAQARRLAKQQFECTAEEALEGVRLIFEVSDGVTGQNRFLKCGQNHILDLTCLLVFLPSLNDGTRDLDRFYLFILNRKKQFSIRSVQIIFFCLSRPSCCRQRLTGRRPLRVFACCSRWVAFHILDLNLSCFWSSHLNGWIPIEPLQAVLLLQVSIFCFFKSSGEREKAAEAAMECVRDLFQVGLHSRPSQMLKIQHFHF